MLSGSLYSLNIPVQPLDLDALSLPERSSQLAGSNAEMNDEPAGYPCLL